jgi:hypothetical protein
MFVGALPNGPAQETGMALVQNINNAVIVNVFSSFSDLVSARRTRSDLFGYRLITIWAKFHKRFSKFRLFQTIGPARPMGRGGRRRLEDALLFVYSVALNTGWRMFGSSLAMEEQSHGV